MLRFRLVHRTYTPLGSSIAQHFWTGQQWDCDTEEWADRTNDYDNAKDAELALLRGFVDVEFDPTLEISK